MIKVFIENMSTKFPIEWDRFTENEGTYDIYGWIERKDGKRDFVLLTLWVDNNEVVGNFVTSSAKYSKAIYEYMYGTSEGHCDCKKISELKKM